MSSSSSFPTHLNEALTLAIQAALTAPGGGSATPLVECTNEAGETIVSLTSVRVQTSRGTHMEWKRAPAAVLGDVLRVHHGGSMDAVRRWCQYNLAGVSWLTETSLVFPDVQLRPWMLWSPWPETSFPPHGRPSDHPAFLDEWTRVELDPDLGTTHGDVGDTGGAEQGAGLFWPTTRGEGGEGDRLFFDIHRAVRSMAAISGNV
jgi:hypothetical protein